jgi:myo-inositol-1-phosphate synthase
VAGQLDGPSSYLMKSPYTQRPDDQARAATEEFIERHARTHEAGRRARETRETREQAGEAPSTAPAG